jgi:hypothetical protein
VAIHDATELMSKCNKEHPDHQHLSDDHLQPSSDQGSAETAATATDSEADTDIIYEVAQAVTADAVPAPTGTEPEKAEERNIKRGREVYSSRVLLGCGDS